VSSAPRPIPIGSRFDDTIGRKVRGGVADDTIGPDPWANVGVNNDPVYLAMREAGFSQLENPSWTDTGAAARRRIEEAFATHGIPIGPELARVMAALDATGLRLLGAAIERCPQLFTQHDALGGTVLTNLEQLASQSLNTHLAQDTSTAEVLTSVLRDIVNPSRISQGDAPTCTVTSMQFDLVADEPAEYARLMAGLTGPTGKVAMLGGGILKSGAKYARALDGRPVSQALFQSACMEFANGKAMDFDPEAGQSTRVLTGSTQRGLKPHQQTTMLRNLFGVRYVTDTFYEPQQGALALQRLRGFDARASHSRTIILDLDQGAINHAVALERVADGVVYYRDPEGVRRSMLEAQFATAVVAMHIPQPKDTAFTR
jgi:hypothetical protein